MQTYGDYNYEPIGYVQPVDMTVCLADLEKENAELEETQPTIIDWKLSKYRKMVGQTVNVEL